jgi:hypothetical protein
MPVPASRQEFAALLNDARRREHLSIRAVAKIADVPATTAQGWLNGKHFPTPALRGNYLKLVEHLDLVHAVPRDLWDESWDALEPALRSGHSPYLGLRPFRVADHELFFGRSSQSARLADAVCALAEREGHGILALVGSSGSGKSSLLAAGLLGREVTSGALIDWTGTELPVIRLLATPDFEPAGEPGRRLVVVDQLEDALALPPRPRQQFLDALAGLAEQAVVVVGLRSDAFGAASSEAVLEPAMSQPILLSSMTLEEFREVIVRPAESVGMTVDEDLVQVLLEELAPASGDRIAPGALPLLSNALLLIWAVGNGRRLTLTDYQAAGGIASAVERLAEQVYLSLDPAQKAAAERMFLRLVRVAGDELVRETLPLADVDATTRPAMDAFVAARMLTTVDDEVRISHQALLSHWARLNDWLAEHRDDLAVMDKLRSAAEVWLVSERDPEALIPVRRLGIFGPWLERATRKRLLTDAEREFVAAAEAHFARECAVVRARRRQLLAWRLATALLALVVGALTIALLVR